MTTCKVLQVFSPTWFSTRLCKIFSSRHGIQETLTQTLLFPQKKFVSVFYAIKIKNTIYYFKPTNFKMPFVNSTFFFGFVYHVFCLPWFETKNKIRCIDAPKCAFTDRNLPESEKYILIIQNVHEKSRFFYISITR